MRIGDSVSIMEIKTGNKADETVLAWLIPAWIILCYVTVGVIISYYPLNSSWLNSWTELNLLQLE